MSAWENADRTLDFYRTLGRDNYIGVPGYDLRIVASRTSAPAARWCDSTNRIITYDEASGVISPRYFPATISDLLAMSGSRAVVAHEFQHGVGNIEGAASNDADFVANAIDEALGDYFGSALSVDPCLANEVIIAPEALGGDDGSPDHYAVDPGCGRNVQVDIHAESFFASEAMDDSAFHDYGIIIGSALWDSRVLSPGNRTQFDAGVLDGVEYWLRSTPTLLEPWRSDAPSWPWVQLRARSWRGSKPPWERSNLNVRAGRVCLHQARAAYWLLTGPGNPRAYHLRD